MKISRGFTTNEDQPLTSPFPTCGWYYFALHGGDVAEPVGFGTNWFAPPYPKRVWRWFCKWNVLPFFSWVLLGKRGYMGFKAYGVDHEQYAEWLCDASEVYEGSLALCITVRNGLTVAVPVAVLSLAALVL